MSDLDSKVGGGKGPPMGEGGAGKGVQGSVNVGGTNPGKMGVGGMVAVITGIVGVMLITGKVPMTVPGVVAVTGGTATIGVPMAIGVMAMGNVAVAVKAFNPLKSGNPVINGENNGDRKGIEP